MATAARHHEPRPNQRYISGTGFNCDRSIPDRPPHMLLILIKSSTSAKRHVDFENGKLQG